MVNKYKLTIPYAIRSQALGLFSLLNSILELDFSWFASITFHFCNIAVTAVYIHLVSAKYNLGASNESVSIRLTTVSRSYLWFQEAGSRELVNVVFD